MKAIEVRQKHIKIADRSELGWAVVSAYEEDELASDSDDEKRIYRAEREAERVAKRKRPGGGNAGRKKAVTGDTAPAQLNSRGQNSQGSRPPAARPRLVGPLPMCRVGAPGGKLSKTKATVSFCSAFGKKGRRKHVC